MIDSRMKGKRREEEQSGLSRIDGKGQSKRMMEKSDTHETGDIKQEDEEYEKVN